MRLALPGTEQGAESGAPAAGVTPSRDRCGEGRRPLPGRATEAGWLGDQGGSREAARRLRQVGGYRDVARDETEPGTLERVRGLMRHPAFALTNPNRTRALIGGFAANPTQFNRPDGAGYDLLADVVLQLDATNPQIAARLLTAMRSCAS